MSACGHWRVDANRTRLGFYISVTTTCKQWADQGYSQCNQWADQGSNQCSQWADEGSNQCSQWADEGHNSCCDWAPCSWFCDALVWIANWVCQAVVWVAKWVCKAVVWVAKWVCLIAVWIVKWVCLALAYIISVIWYLIIVLIWEACRPFGSGGPRASPINHVFVLMLENRAFDHMLGFSGIAGTDAETGGPRSIEDITGMSNSFGPATPPATGLAVFPVTRTACWTMPIDPGHEFEDTLKELCFSEKNQNPAYDSTIPNGYPQPITNGGFVASWAGDHGGAPAEIMRCYTEDQVPVLTQLAREFAVCDRYFSSVPGPTWPNRFFVHAASSAGLANSPDSPAIAGTVDGFKFENGTIYDLLEAEAFDWKIYSGDIFPQSLAISGMNLAFFEGHFGSLEDFAEDVADSDYSTAYAFLEPDYGNDLVGKQTFKGGSSQHPLDDITSGEKLIKFVYEAIRNSPHWEDSVLIVTYDEHGGFYDHVAPPSATPPGDRVTIDTADRLKSHGFRFDQLGVRIPAVVISPRIRRGTIDHRTYDHSSVVKTIEDIFDLEHLTDRDAMARSLTTLLTVDPPRMDAPTQLVDAADSSRRIEGCNDDTSRGDALTAGGGDTKNGGRYQTMDPALRGFVHIALLRDLVMTPPAEQDAKLEHYAQIETRLQAQEYMRDVRRRFVAFAATGKRPEWLPKRRRPRRRVFPRFR